MSCSKNCSQKIFSIAALLFALGIIAGAFGAHGIRDYVSPVRFAAFETGVLYHLLNSLGLFTLCIAQRGEMISERLLQRSATLLITGIILFSGSLYLLVLLDIPRLGMVTPIGGTLLIASWLFVAIGACRK